MGFTPAFLMFGRDLQILTDTILAKLRWLGQGSVTGGISAPCEGEVQCMMKFPSATRGAEAC